MKRLFAVVAVTAVFSGSVLGQAPAPRPAFDVAGIQISTRPQPGMRGGQLRGNRYEMRNATMVDLIRTAYNVQPERISGGPSWLEWNRFDIAALAPEKTSSRSAAGDAEDAAGRAVQAGRARGHGDHDRDGAEGEGHPQVEGVSTPGGGCKAQSAPGPNGVAEITATCSMTMAQFVEQLPRNQSAYFPNGQKLIDETGLSGSWDFQLKFTPRPLLGQAGSDGITLQAALEKIGLVMEPKEIKVPAIVVDTATADFTPNAPDLAKRMPPLPAPQFEVAVLKMSPPEANRTVRRCGRRARSISAARR